MSIATAVQTIGFRSKSGSYTAYVFCNKGDFYQEYWNGGASYAPDYEAMAQGGNPCELEFVAYSSLSATQITCLGLDVYVGDSSQAIGWDSNNVSTGSCAGFLKLVPPAGNAGTWKVQVIKNPIEVFGTNSFALRFEALAAASGSLYSDRLKAYVNCDVRKSGSTDLRATIYEITDGTHPELSRWHISKKGQKVLMQVAVGSGGSGPGGSADSTAEYQIKWYLQDLAQQSGWREIQCYAGHANQCEVAEGDIGSYGVVKAEALDGEGNVVASDMQGIWDVQDPLSVMVGADTDELWFEEGQTSKVITFKPWVTDNASARYPEYKRFRFALINAVGTILNGDYSTDYTIDNTSDATYAAAAGWPLGYDAFANHQSSLELTITAM